MNRIIITLFAICLMPAAHAGMPADFNAVYQLKKFGMNAAEARISLKRQNEKTWVYTSSSKPRGVISMFRSDKISEKSVMQNLNGTVKPVSYDYIHKGSKKNRNQSIRFDWQQGKADMVIKGHSLNMDIPPDTIDNFSLQVRIMDSLHAGQNNLSYPVLKKGKLKTNRFENEGQENIEVPAGSFKAIIIKRIRQDSKRVTKMWLVPELHYLPVKIQHIEPDESTFSLNLISLRGKLTKGKTYGEDDD